MPVVAKRPKSVVNKIQLDMDLEVQHAPVSGLNGNDAFITGVSPQTKPREDITKCIEMLEKIILDVMQIAKEAEDKDWGKILPQLFAVIELTIHDIECFRHAAIGELVDVSLSRYTTLDGAKRQDIVDRVEQANNALYALASSLQAKDWSRIVENTKKLYTSLTGQTLDE